MFPFFTMALFHLPFQHGVTRPVNETKREKKSLVCMFTSTLVPKYLLNFNKYHYSAKLHDILDFYIHPLH